MTSLMSLSAVSPGNASTLNIDLCSRFLSYGRWIDVEQDWMPIIQNYQQEVHSCCYSLRGLPFKQPAHKHIQFHYLQGYSIRSCLL